MMRKCQDFASVKGESYIIKLILDSLSDVEVSLILTIRWLNYNQRSQIFE